jgi:hypothetical protein
VYICKNFNLYKRYDIKHVYGKLYSLLFQLSLITIKIIEQVQPNPDRRKTLFTYNKYIYSFQDDNDNHIIICHNIKLFLILLSFNRFNSKKTSFYLFKF